MSSIGRGNLKCIKCGRIRPYWADHCAKCRREIEAAKQAVKPSIPATS